MEQGGKLNFSLYLSFKTLLMKNTIIHRSFSLRGVAVMVNLFFFISKKKKEEGD